MWWFSAAFTALLVVTVVGVGFYFLPVMFAPPPREPDFSDIDELLKVSRPVPDIGTSSAAHPAGNIRPQTEGNDYLVTEYRGKTTAITAASFEIAGYGEDANVVFLDGEGRNIAFFLRPWSVEKR